MLLPKGRNSGRKKTAGKATAGRPSLASKKATPSAHGCLAGIAHSLAASRTWAHYHQFEVLWMVDYIHTSS